MKQQPMTERLAPPLMTTYEDDRGVALAFADGIARNMHVVSMTPGATRGNHVHDCDEILCIMGGAGIRHLTLEDSRTHHAQEILVERSLQTYRIQAGVRHTVHNTGAHEYYLLAFWLRDTDLVPEETKES